MLKWQELLIKSAHEIGIELNTDKIDLFELYMDMLISWNEKMNLTAITAPDEIAVKHFFDSLTLAKCIDFSNEVKMIDVGTGAGFPSIPLLIVYPHIDVTMLDSLNKRLLFLEEILKTLNLNAKLVHARAEEKSRVPEHREKYDLSTARAVANMNQLCEYCMPYVKVGGYFAAMKGSNGQKELDDAVNAVDMLGGQPERIESFNLPDNSERNIILIKKVSSTPDKYPRNSGKINKNPLK